MHTGMEGVCVAVWVLLIHLCAVCNGPILVSCVHHVHFYAFLASTNLLYYGYWRRSRIQLRLECSLALQQHV